MTDKEIIKAFEICVCSLYCLGCPYYDLDGDVVCFRKLWGDITNLINRQKAEIEKLNVELVGMRGACNSYKMHYDNAQAEIERLNKEVDRLSQIVLYNDGIVSDLEKDLFNAKAEAIKEFAERLCEDRVSNDPVVIAVKAELEKMVGEDK